jgi:uncharacterized phage-associated protein
MNVRADSEPASAADVAAEFRRRLPDITDRQLHCLLYFAQGHHLAMFDEPLFRESIIAGPDGPVVVFDAQVKGGA